MELNNQYIGSLIKSMRKRVGLTQCELAERIGVVNKTVSKWEQGRGIPDISLLYRLSLALDTDIESILSGSLEDLGNEWIGIVYTGENGGGAVGEKRDLEYLISMFLLVGIRNAAVISSEDRRQENEILLKEYQKKGFLKSMQCDSSFERFTQNTEMRKRRICFLFQPAFLYGMHLTRYMRRAMLRDKITVLALRQGGESFMPTLHYDSNFLCTSFQGKQTTEYDWRMFPMIFGSGKYLEDYFMFADHLKDNAFNADTLWTYFKEVYVEPMERGMLAFSMQTESDRRLAGKVLSGIEESQHIRIGDLEEIMAVRRWK